MDKINRLIGARPSLEWVPIDKIYVDSNYQRDVRGNRVAKIVKNFNWPDFGALNLTRQTDGRFSVVDGQHRLAAARLHPDIDEVPAAVSEASDLAAEARSFVTINTVRAAVTPVERYWAAIAAGDKQALHLQTVLETAECEVVPEAGVKRPHMTTAVTALFRALKTHGDGAVIAALQTIRVAWPSDATALAGTLINAVARIHRNNEGLQVGRLRRVLAAQTRAEFTANAEAMRKIAGGSAELSIAKTLVELYNRGLSKNTIEIGAAR